MNVCKTCSGVFALIFATLWMNSLAMAAPIVSYYYLPPNLNGPGTEQIYTMTSSPPGHAGDRFVDNLIFNTAPFQDGSFSFGAMSNLGTNGIPGVVFKGFTLTDAAGATYNFTDTFLTPAFIGGLASLSSGTYDLVITGMLLQNGGAYSFFGMSDQVADPAQVPEPHSLALAGLGLLAAGAALRRSSNQ